jgi:hypothetical protein
VVLLLVSNAARIFGFHINNFQFTVFFTVLTIPVYTYIRRKTCKFIEGMCLSPSLLYCIVLYCWCYYWNVGAIMGHPTCMSVLLILHVSISIVRFKPML